MASEKAIAFALGILSEAFPTRDVTPRTADVWLAIFAEVPDANLSAATLAVSRDGSRTFFPTTGELFAAIDALHPRAPIDVSAILNKIDSLGTYSPNSGWLRPCAARIRSRLGDAVADAYVAAGSLDCFSDNDVTRDIARRAFAKELSTSHPNGLTAPEGRPALISGESGLNRTLDGKAAVLTGHTQ